MDNLLGLFDAIAKGEAPRIARTWVNGLTVSTVNSWDCGPETAILDASRAYPVERYFSEEEALAGHERWVEKCRQGLTVITKLGYGHLIESETVTLQPETEE